MNITYQANQVKQYDHDRYICCLFASSAEQTRLFTILAFNTEISLISEQTSDLAPALMRITWWQDAIDDLYQGKLRQHSLIKDLNEIIVQQKIPVELFRRFLQARMIELHKQPPKNMAELIHFSENTGANLLEIIAYSVNFLQPERFRNLGTAWSLLGILRSIKYIKQTGKPMLFPLELLTDNFVIGDQCSKIIVKEIANEAEKLLNQVEQNLFSKSTAALDLLFFLAQYYLRLLKKNDYDILSDKLSLNPVFKQLYLSYRYLRFC